jgi:hypothetical protein
MGISRKNFIDFEIIAFKGRRCFFVPYMVGSASFDSRWHEKLELNKVEILKIYNVWNVRFLWKVSLR